MLLLAWMAVLALGCGATSSANRVLVTPVADAGSESAVIRFVKRHDLPLANTSVNGQHVGFFLVDTGSSVTVIGKENAQKLRLAKIGEGRVTGIAGTETVDIATIDELVVDQVRFPGHEVRIVDLAAIQRNVGWPIAGILGINMLGDQPFTIDYQTATVTLHAPDRFAAPQNVTPQKLEMIGRIPAVLVVAGTPQNPSRIWLQIDSGMNAELALPRRMIDANPALLAGVSHRHHGSVGVGGTAQNVRTELAALDFGGRSLTGIPAMIEINPPQPPYRGVDVGRVGNRLLREAKLTFDVRTSRFWVEWYKP